MLHRDAINHQQVAQAKALEELYGSNFSYVPDFQTRGVAADSFRLRNLITIAWSRPFPEKIAGHTQQLFERTLAARIQFRQDEEIEIDVDQMRADLFNRGPGFIISELLDNACDSHTRLELAVKNSESAGLIELALGSHSDYILIDISDSGTGFGSVNQAPGSIWASYDHRRLPANYTLPSLIGQCGIALTWSKALCESYGGTLLCFSPGIRGFSATARLVLPRDSVSLAVPL